MKKVIAPKGYFFRIIKDAYYCTSIQLHKRNKRGTKEVGHVNLVREYSACYSTHSYLSPSYRNKGLGALMYAKAIQYGIEQGWRVRSSGGSSTEAQRVWRGSTLKRWFDVKVRLGKNYHDKTPNPDYDTFFPRPKEEKKRCRVLSKKRPAKKRK